MKKIVSASFVVLSVLAACKSTKKTTAISIAPKSEFPMVFMPLDCSSKTLTYSADIKSIIEPNCANCHNETYKSGYNFLTIESVKKSAASGHLLGSIKQLRGYDPMPDNAAKFDQATIDKIECWINSGMKD